LDLYNGLSVIEAEKRTADPGRDPQAIMLELDRKPRVDRKKLVSALVQQDVAPHRTARRGAPSGRDVGTYRKPTRSIANGHLD
jgi:hypothetical protein